MYVCTYTYVCVYIDINPSSVQSESVRNGAKLRKTEAQRKGRQRKTQERGTGGPRAIQHTPNDTAHLCLETFSSNPPAAHSSFLRTCLLCHFAKEKSLPMPSNTESCAAAHEPVSFNGARELPSGLVFSMVYKTNNEKLPLGHTPR